MISTYFKAGLRFQSYQFKVSEVDSYQCILSLGGLGGSCLFRSVLGGDCKSTDSRCNTWKGLVGSDWEAKKIFYIWNYFSFNRAKWRWGNKAWNTVCLSYNRPASNLKVFVNGQTFQFPVTNIHDVPREKMEIFFMNSKNLNHSFHGALTDVQLWSRRLTDSEMAAWADCVSDSAGDLIDWSSAELSITGLTQLAAAQTERERDSICGRNSDRRIIAAFNRRLDFYHSVKFCSNFGEIASAREERERDQMLESLEAIEGHTCNTDLISAGMLWSEPAKAWSEFTTGDGVVVENWYPGRPSNNTEVDNCLFVLTYDKTFYDTACQFSELCPVCRLTKVRTGCFYQSNISSDVSGLTIKRSLSGQLGGCFLSL